MIVAGALEGIRVIDFGQWLAGPLTAMLLADQGAEVIHVDPLDGPRWRHPANATLNRGKTSLDLDLKSAGDRAFAHRLVDSADVVVENFRPGVMDRLGLGWDALHRANHRLVYCSLPGFASDDPRSGVAAWEGVVAAATGSYPTGPGGRRTRPAEPSANGEPRFTALTLASQYAGLAGAIGVVMALIARERDGLGQRIEVPLHDAMFLAIGASGLLVDGKPSGGRPGDQWGGTYRCKDGGLVLLTLPTDRFVHRFVEATEKREDWTAKGYLGHDLIEDTERWAKHNREMNELFLSRTADEWDQLATKINVPVVKIRTSEEWMASRHAQDAGIFVPIDDPQYGRMLQPGPSAILRGSPAGPPRARSQIEDRDRLLRETHASAESKGASTGRVRAALEGFRVVDTTAVLAGPTAGRTLAEFGAEVIKVNNPWEQGAGYRWQVHRYHTDVNRGKESILIDLKTPEGLNVLGRLIDTSDAFLQNMRLGVAERLGIGYEQIRARKPDIVYMSISAFGYGGEWQYRPGYEPVAQSFSGMQARSGGGANRAGGQPYAVNDYCTGLLGAFAVGLGLFHRLRTGEGQNVETSLAHAATFLQLPYMQVYEGKTWDEPAGPEAKGWSPLQRLYRAADGWFFLGASPAQIESVSKVVGIALEELPHKDLEAALSKGFGALTTGDCLARLTAAGIGAYALGITAGDLMRDLWNIDHGLCVTQRYKEGTMVTTIGPPWRLSRTPVSPRHIVSPPGADAEAVLAKIGMADRLAELVEKRVVVLE